MSAAAVRAALGVRGLTPGVKFVLVVMAEHANSETYLSWPSAALVAEETGLARPTVATALKALRQRGLITDAGRVRQVIRYQVDPARLVALADMSPDVEDLSPVVRHLSPVLTSPVTCADTEQEGTTRVTTRNLPAAQSAAPSPVRVVQNAYAQVVTDQRGTVTGTAMKRVGAEAKRLLEQDGVALEVVRQAAVTAAKRGALTLQPFVVQPNSAMTKGEAERLERERQHRVWEENAKIIDASRGML